MISKYDTLKKDIFRLNEDEEFYKAYYRAGHSSEAVSYTHLTDSFGMS